MKPPSQTISNNESGNILIYILGAIFLLGILIVVSKGSMTPGAGIDPEKLMIRVTEIRQYGKDLERGIAFIMANGHSEADIRFAHPNASSVYGDITDDPSRQIFAKAGGGVTYTDSTDVQVTPTDWIFNATNSIPSIGSSSADLIALLPYVSEEFCIKINEANDVDNPSGVPPTDPDNFDITTLFVGNFLESEILGTASVNEFKNEGCLQGSGTPPSNTYHYYRVLLAR